ncbi:MAG: hypothetical protein IJO48_01755, partial [Clostridia bacterium]|nr:hypothetical protein [Clostridia bacterium]
FKKEKHSVNGTAMALTNILTGVFMLILWVIWLFDESRNMTWFLLVVIGATVMVYGYSAFGLLSASTGSNDKKVLNKNNAAFAVACACIGAAVIYIGSNGLVLV